MKALAWSSAGRKKPEDLKKLRRGWCWGGERFFREGLLALLGEETGEHHYGEEIRGSAEAKAEQLVQEDCRRASWKRRRI